VSQVSIWAYNGEASGKGILGVVGFVENKMGHLRAYESTKDARTAQGGGLNRDTVTSWRCSRSDGVTWRGIRMSTYLIQGSVRRKWQVMYYLSVPVSGPSTRTLSEGHRRCMPCLEFCKPSISCKGLKLLYVTPPRHYSIIKADHKKPESLKSKHHKQMQSRPLSIPDV
jgi:hypothetical protein